MSSLYNMLVLTALLSYGLIQLPLYMWTSQDLQFTLFNELSTAQQVRSDYRTAMVEFYMIVSQCKNMIATKANNQNETFLRELERELPKKDLEGQNIGVSSQFF